MEERRKTIKGIVTLLHPMLFWKDGKACGIKKIDGKFLIVEREDSCYVVAPVTITKTTTDTDEIFDVSLEEGYMLPIKEKFDELEEVK